MEDIRRITVPSLVSIADDLRGFMGYDSDRTLTPEDMSNTLREAVSLMEECYMILQEYSGVTPPEGLGFLNLSAYTAEACAAMLTNGGGGGIIV